MIKSVLYLIHDLMRPLFSLGYNKLLKQKNAALLDGIIKSIEKNVYWSESFKGTIYWYYGFRNTQKPFSLFVLKYILKN